MKIEIDDTGKWQNSFTLKVILLAFIGICLLIPLEMVKSIISERQANSEKTRKEISFQWAGSQTISGPILNIPLLIHPEKEGDESYKVIVHVMPEVLEINGEVKTEKRHRSIYEAVVYSSDLQISGEFLIPPLNQDEKGEVLWGEAYYSLGISDNRGLKGGVTLQAGSVQADAVPGLKETDLFKSGITFPASVNKDDNKFNFSLKMQLSGSESINFTPLGKTTRVRLKSPWEAPGFTGNFLPAERSVSESGFDASWLVTNLNRNFPQTWQGNAYTPESESFGTEFILEADHYQKSLRTAKYGILFIALTFLAILFVEMSTKVKIQIFHYLLLALGLVLFFSLLNALSEHTGFNIAYLVAASSTIILISFFLNSIVHKVRPVLMISGLLVFLYSFIFILLTLKDFAYLAGNIGLFIILAITMKVSLKLKEM